MRKVALSVLIAASTLGFSNPLRRICLNAGGLFEAIPISSTDDVPLCRFGQAAIDAQTLVSSLEGDTHRAAQLILADSAAESDCSDVGARTFGPLPDLCVFSDGSKLSLNTIQMSPSQGDRVRLKNALLQR